MSRQQKRSETDILNRGFREPFLLAGDCPFIKHLNWFTGFGKTYTAAFFSLELFLKYRVVPVFIAPMQSLVKGFVDDVRKQSASKRENDEVSRFLKERGRDVPIYLLYSRDYHRNDRTFFEAVLKLYDWLVQNREVLSMVEVEVARERSAASKSNVSEMRRRANICLTSSFHDVAPGDDTYEDAKAAYFKATSSALSSADGVIRRLITLSVDRAADSRWRDVLQVPPVAEMVRRLQPLQAFLKDPGVIAGTASKSQVQQQLYAFDPERGCNRWFKFETLADFLAEINREGSVLGRSISGTSVPARAVVFLDEEEDAYWYQFDSRRSVVNAAGRHDLNVVITEFFAFLDFRWPIAFEKSSDNYTLASKVYQNLEMFASVAPAVWREYAVEASSKKAQHIPDQRRVEILRAKLIESFPGGEADDWSDSELLEVLHRLLDRNDGYKDFEKFRLKANILADFRTYVASLGGLTGYSQYREFKRVRALVVDKKYFTMSRSSYGEVLDQPSQTFFSAEASVMDTAFLRRVELSEDTAGQTIRLEYHQSDVPESAYTLFNYLQLVLFIAGRLNVESGEKEITFSPDDHERYPNLVRFRGEVRKLFSNKNTKGGFENDTFADQLLTDDFFFGGTKSVVTLEESRWKAEEYNLPADINLTATITSLLDTPETDVLKALGRNNGVYLMSATGGLIEASSGAFNMGELRRGILARGGQYERMTDAETDIVSERADNYLARRERCIQIIDDDSPVSSFEPSGGFNGLQQFVHEAFPAKGEFGYAPLNTYKRHEIDGLVATLDKLLSTELRSGLVLTQTVQRIRPILQKLSGNPATGIRQVDDDGHHFVIAPVLPFYRKSGNREPVTLILYTAARFRRRDPKEIGTVHETDDAGQFSQELINALDITEHKVLLWSAYGSASRGLDFVTTDKGMRKDFELFCLLNDPYYTHHTRPGERGFSMEMFQSYLQVVRDTEDGWPAMSRRDVLYDYSRNRWRRLRKEHYIDITRTLFQALGRGERCPEAKMPPQYIYVSSRAAQMVHLGTRCAPELVSRASPAQRALLRAIAARNLDMQLFDDDNVRRQHVTDSLKRAVALREFTSDTPARFRSSDSARQLWTRLFSPSMFTDPASYLETLRTAGVTSAFVDSAFQRVRRRVDLYTREVSRVGVTESILTDSFDGTDVYNWVEMLAPPGLLEKIGSVGKALAKGRNGFLVSATDNAERLFPQPWFVTEIMKGYLAELEFERFVEQQFGVTVESNAGAGPIRFIDMRNHPLEADIFQVYDYYLEVADSDVIVAVDVKNWARITDRLKKDELEAEAVAKHQRISQIFKGRTVRAVYLNLHGAHKYHVQYSAEGGIRFMSLYVHPADTWIYNDNLVGVLLAR